MIPIPLIWNIPTDQKGQLPVVVCEQAIPRQRRTMAMKRNDGKLRFQEQRDRITKYEARNFSKCINGIPIRFLTSPVGIPKMPDGLAICANLVGQFHAFTSK